MAQSQLLVFESTEFADRAGDDEETNPGVSGKSLAQWLAQQLRARGHSIGEVVPEDFGWCLPLDSNAGTSYIACSSEGPDTWQAFVFSEGDFISRLLGRDAGRDRVAAAFAAVKTVLQTSQQVRRLREVWL